MSRMHAPDDPEQNPDGDGGAQATDCRICGETVGVRGMPTHIATEHDLGGGSDG